jgi:hypothetical protein
MTIKIDVDLSRLTPAQRNIWAADDKNFEHLIECYVWNISTITLWLDGSGCQDGWQFEQYVRQEIDEYIKEEFGL